MRIPIILSQCLLFFYNTHYFLYSIYTKNRKVGYVDKYGTNVTIVTIIIIIVTIIFIYSPLSIAPVHSANSFSK